jgi:hypothetical protein
LWSLQGYCVLLNILALCYETRGTRATFVLFA